jgi:hypothetical protein
VRALDYILPDNIPSGIAGGDRHVQCGVSHPRDLGLERLDPIQKIPDDPEKSTRFRYQERYSFNDPVRPFSSGPPGGWLGSKIQS